MASSVVKHFFLPIAGAQTFSLPHKMAPNKPTQRCTPHGRANAWNEKYKHPKCLKHQVSEALRLPHVWPHDVTGPIRSLERARNNTSEGSHLPWIMPMDCHKDPGKKTIWLRTSHCQKVPGPPHRSTFHALLIFSKVFKHDICCDIPYQNGHTVFIADSCKRLPLPNKFLNKKHRNVACTVDIPLQGLECIRLSKNAKPRGPEAKREMRSK